MKHLTLLLALAALALTSCGGLQNTTAPTAKSSAGTGTTTAIAQGLGDLLGELINGTSTPSETDLAGTWQYQGSNCVFESENLLAKAGGEMAAASLEQKLDTQLATIGIKKGACSFTFNKDKNYSAKIGSRTIHGQYTINTAKKPITLAYMGGLGTMSPHIVKSGNNLSLLFESDKLLSLVKTASALSNNSTIKTASTLLGNYEGLYIGLKLKK